MVKYLNIKSLRFWAGTLLAQFLLFYIFSKLNFVIHFFEAWFELQKGIHQKLFSWFSFSVGDLLYIILGVVLLRISLKIVLKKSRRKGVLSLLIFLNIFYFTYQIFWGMLYFQKPLIENLPKQEPTLDDAKILALTYLNRCKATRGHVSEDKNGVFRIEHIQNIEEEILNNQNTLPKFAYKKTTGVESIKPSLFKKVMNYSGILGYYNPFTAEAQYNSQLPSSYVPFTIAHESAHQLGFAREQEANFIGYLLGKNSKNKELKYATEWFVLKSLLNAISKKDSDFVEKILAQFSEPMKRDLEFERQFREKHQGMLDAFFGFTNNLFLKSNQQDGSVTYSYFVDLLLRYEKPQ